MTLAGIGKHLHNLPVQLEYLKVCEVTHLNQNGSSRQRLVRKQSGLQKKRIAPCAECHAAPDSDSTDWGAGGITVRP